MSDQSITDRTTILRLDCSPGGEASYSCQLGDALLEALRTRHPGAALVARNLADSPPSPVTEGFTLAMRTHQTAALAATAPALAESEALIAELEASQVLVIATPMHNFTVPAVLKLWLDQVVRFGRTFRSTPEGKTGLLADRPCYVCIASGSLFSGEAARQPDHLTPYLSAILACMGIRDVTYFRAEAAARDPEAVMARTLAAIAALAVPR